MKLRVLVAIVIVSGVARSHAQAPQPGAPGLPAQTAQAVAPIDLTGYWVSIVNEDWLWRMVTPPKGDYASVPLNAEGRKVADAWTAGMDGRCEAYGAAGLMRMPTRVRMTWQDDRTLKLETDAGVQTRLLRFGVQASTSEPRSRQGSSVATWEFAGRNNGLGGFAFAPFAPPPGPPPGPGAARGAGGGRGGPGGPGGPRFGTLKVVTGNLLPGWLRKNGVPYSEGAVVTEYYDRFKSTNGDEWFVVTTVVDDAKYLQQEFVTSSHFKKEADGAKWNPSACKTT